MGCLAPQAIRAGPATCSEGAKAATSWRKKLRSGRCKEPQQQTYEDHTGKPGKPLQALIAGLQKSQQPVSIDAGTATSNQDGSGWRWLQDQDGHRSVFCLQHRYNPRRASLGSCELRNHMSSSIPSRPSQSLLQNNLHLGKSMPISRRNQAGPARL